MDFGFNKVVGELRKEFLSGKTFPYSFRVQQLNGLSKMLDEHQEDICHAMNKDLKKPRFEAFNELMLCKAEVVEAIRCLSGWMKPEKTPFNALALHDEAFVRHEPYGVVLIISTWNYPFYLALIPLIGAITAGNCAVIKLSELSVSSTAKLEQLLMQYIDWNCFKVVKGGPDESIALLKEKFDFILCTSSTRVGLSVMKAAAETLTPVVLELGGKSPIYIDDTANIKLAAKRILWGKCQNIGMICLSPDHLICSKKVEKQLIKELKECMQDFYGDNWKTTPDLARMVNIHHFGRLKNLLARTKGNIVIGGEMDDSDLYISPTIVVDVTESDSLMEEELFGPILPILNAETPMEAYEMITSRKGKPLAMYVFSTDKEVKELFIEKCPSGSLCFNDVIFQGSWFGLPFGGVGNSGMGRYHGKYSYEAFSNKKSVVVRNYSFVTETMSALRYPPYDSVSGRMKLIRFFFTNFTKFDLPPFQWSDLLKVLLGMAIMFVALYYSVSTC